MSKLSDVLADFGFTEKSASGEVVSETEVQKAFLENLYLAGYFKPEFIWQAINLMQYDKAGNLDSKYDASSREFQRRWDKAGGTDAVFLKLSNAIIKAGGDQENPEKFKPEVLLHSLFEDKAFDRQDVEDMLIYLSQSAFGRILGQERSELSRQNWQTTHKERYMKNARKLGMIEAVDADAKEVFDEAWIQGAGRFRTYTRTKSLKDAEVKYKRARVLTGERELWVEIDKLPVDSKLTGEEKTAAEQASIEEAKKFMLDLAAENGISLCGFEERVVAGSKRTYPKYGEGETRKLTETMMAKKIYRDVFGCNLEADEIVDSAAAASEVLRPDTYKTAMDATRGLLVERLRADSTTPLKILVVSNQPYVDRQVLTNKRAVKEALKKEGLDDSSLHFSGFGEPCEVGVAAVHSEFGALAAEGFMCRSVERDLPRKCKTDQLMFSSRCKDVSLAGDAIIITAKPRAERVSQETAKIIAGK